jgi:EAL domain-containing protein (putative c-di-GMP-specific phosphodiesterase class I)
MLAEPAVRRHAMHRTADPDFAADHAPYSLAYSAEIGELLRRLWSDASIDIDGFVERFYHELQHRAEARVLLGRLSPGELARLKRRQAAHLAMLLDPTLSTQAHYDAALRVGRVHELVGLGMPALLEGYHLYQEQIHQLLFTLDMPSAQREQLIAALHQRVLLDIEAQTKSHVRFAVEVAQTFVALERVTESAGSLAALLRDSLQVLTALDGMVAALFARPDAQGALQIEAYGGQAGRAYAQAFLDGRVVPFAIDPGQPGGMGPAGVAWRSGEVQIRDMVGLDGDADPWRAELDRLGLRTVASIPLLDDAARPFAVLNLYSGFPGFFSGAQREVALRHIQQTMSRAVQRQERSQVIPVQLRRAYAQLLDDGAVQMHYQPIVDLRSGRVDHVEALARMRQADGTLIAPGQFLPTLDADGLLQLFRLGLEQVCSDLHGRPRPLPVALNMPAEALDDGRWRDAVFDALTRWRLPPSLLQLELLETQDARDPARRDRQLDALRQRGIRIVQDDLGSGHSSLLRMDRIAFDGVKIDQALVRGAHAKPLRALEFITHLTRLAHGVGARVTVEGLEDAALIEAAAVLGADCGQGYGIARPMPPQQWRDWPAHWRLPIDPAQPTSALGALAALLLWEQQLGALSAWPALLRDYVALPCRVRAYVQQDPVARAPLGELLQRSHAAALDGDAAYAQARVDVVDWLCRAIAPAAAGVAQGSASYASV